MTLHALVGHKDTQSALTQLLGQGKLPHAMMFHGPKGVGKRHTAEIFARQIICGADPANMFADGTFSFDVHSDRAAQMEAGSSPDFHVLEPEEGKKTLRVEPVRNLISALAMSSEGSRVVIVDAADNMTREAANALLKTLEEPNPGVFMILICHSLGSLLPTIVSRCRKFRFAPLSQNEAVQVVASQASQMGADKAAAVAALKTYPGCPGQALALAGKGQEAMKVIDGILAKSRVSATELFEATEALQRKQAADIGVDYLLSVVAQYAKESTDAGQSLRWSEAHKNIAQRRAEMLEINISPQLTLETSLADVIELKN